MAVYNGEAFLAQALDSILSQQGVEFELVVVDDGSTDETPSILAACKDPRLVILRNAANIGLTASLNRGLSLARAPFVARQDADDVSLPGRLATQAEHLERTGADICFCRCEMLQQTLGHTSSWVELPEPLRGWRSLFTNHFGAHPAVMFRKDAIAGLGGYDPSYKRGQDYELWDRSTAAGLKFVYLPQELLLYRIHPEAISHQFSRDQLDSGRLISERALRRHFPGISQEELDGLRWLLFEPLKAKPSDACVEVALAGLINRIDAYCRSVAPPTGPIWSDAATQLTHRLWALKGRLWRHSLAVLFLLSWRDRGLVLFKAALRYLVGARSQK